MRLRESDIQTLGHWLSPDFVIPAARSACREDPVLGADSAYMEVRGLIRDYRRFVRHREKEERMSLEFASALRAMGYVGVHQPVTPIDSEWSRTALEMWGHSRGEINGWTEPIEVGDVRQSLIHRSVIRVLGALLRSRPELNLAILQGRLYRRETVHVMVHIEARGVEGPRSYVLSPLGMDDGTLQKRMRRARMALLRSEQHPLRHLGFQLLRAWARVGLVASPAACMVSFAGQHGHAALAPFNGIPMAVQVGPLRNGTVTLYLTLDHRAYNGSQADQIYRFLEEGLKSCV